MTYFVLLGVVRTLGLDHVLLKRTDAENIFDFEVLHRSVVAFGVDHEPLPISEHPRLDPEVFDRLIVEIRQHRFVGRDVHRQIVVRTMKQFGFVLMAVDAGITAHITRGHFLRRFPIAISKQDTASQNHQQQPNSNSDLFRHSRFSLYDFRGIQARGTSQ